ncbi:hypothetical protein KC19_11G055600 [Ceratodon purpureus]|uniref:Uncharacterized protein n=1 Tax=Ceratodon purpureus TaxID=3225 RepID=A0A8T0GF61_CERPU|nr:hypothetical protein KC19_11G055600 [Ceratodon purpureus]
MALTVTCSAISAQSGLYRRSDRDGTHKVRTNKGRRNGEDVHTEDLDCVLKNVTFLVQSRAQFSVIFTRKVLDFFQMNFSCERSSELAICFDPVLRRFRQSSQVSFSSNRDGSYFCKNNDSIACKPAVSRSFESKSFAFRKEFSDAGWGVGLNSEGRDEPCVPMLTLPEPVHRCTELPCPICKKR